MQDIFRFVQTGVREGRVDGQFTATGVRPKFMDRIESAGLSLPPEMFVPANQAGSSSDVEGTTGTADITSFAATLVGMPVEEAEAAADEREAYHLRHAMAEEETYTHGEIMDRIGDRPHQCHFCLL